MHIGGVVWEGRRDGGPDKAGDLGWSACSVVMSLHVSMEVPRLRESEVADLATIWLLTTVDALVLSQSGSISEGFSTEVTAVWPLTRVGAEVSRHRGTLGEAFLAYWTAKRLLP